MSVHRKAPLRKVQRCVSSRRPMRNEQWLNRDPLGDVGNLLYAPMNKGIYFARAFNSIQEYRAMNLYSMVDNDPVGDTDALGLAGRRPNPPRPYRPLNPKKPCARDCDGEETDCEIRGTLFCGIIGLADPPLGVACAAGYLDACHHEKKECEQDNKNKGF